MLSKLTALFLLILILVVACTNNTNDKVAPPVNDEEEITVEGDSILSLEGAAKDRLIAWLHYIHPAYDLSMDSFKLSSVWIEDSLLPMDYGNEAEFLALYKPYLIQSPDKNYALDLDSYNIILTKNKNDELIGYSGEPDAQAFLLDNKLGKKYRLLFFGPGNHIDEAYWLDAETFVLMGIFDESDDAVSNYQPSIYKINIKENLFEKYIYEVEIPNTMVLEYAKHTRYKDIKIR